MRGATEAARIRARYADVSIHAPHAGRDLPPHSVSTPTICFNPRAPCGARPVHTNSIAGFPMFQSTRPMRGATRTGRTQSPHLLFQSTRPMRGATFSGIPLIKVVWFQSTRPMRGATSPRPIPTVSVALQSPRPMGGATSPWIRACTGRRGFNPRAPCGARPTEGWIFKPCLRFQSTRPMRGATLGNSSNGRDLWVSIHAPHAGRDPARRRSAML